MASLLSLLATPTEPDPAHQPRPAKLRGLPVTFASMIYTDGTRTINGIYRGLLIGPKGQRRINGRSRSTVLIASEEISGDRDHCATVQRLAEKYATPDWPAVDWSL